MYETIKPTKSKKMPLVKRPKAYEQVGLSPQKTYKKSVLFKMLIEEKLVNKEFKTRLQKAIVRRVDIAIPYLEQIDAITAKASLWKSLCLFVSLIAMVLLVLLIA
jgi:hypothetical protein